MMSMPSAIMAGLIRRCGMDLTGNRSWSPSGQIARWRIGLPETRNTRSPTMRGHLPAPNPVPAR